MRSCFSRVVADRFEKYDGYPNDDEHDSIESFTDLTNHPGARQLSFINEAAFVFIISLPGYYKLHRINHNELNRNKIHSSWNLYTPYTTHIHNTRHNFFSDYMTGHNNV